MVKSPILIIGYNRPDISAITLSWVKRSRPNKVYFAVDGPKDSNDALLVDSVKQLYLEGLPGSECIYLFNDINLGPDLTISNAISFVLKQEDRVVVLEDDVIAPPAFFLFADQMLDKFSDNDRISMITGSNFVISTQESEEDYFFAYSGSTLSGWATWRRAWNIFSLKEPFKITKQDLKDRFSDKHQIGYYNRAFKVFSWLPRGANTWDCCWQFERIKFNKLTVIPSKNLTINIGEYGTHFSGPEVCHTFPYDDSFEVTRHPSSINCKDKWEEDLFNNYLASSMIQSALSNIRIVLRLLKVKRQYGRSKSKGISL